MYLTSGIKLENTPVDVLASTASAFAGDDFYDRYGTASRITSAGISADNLRMSGEQAELGGLLNAELTLSKKRNSVMAKIPTYSSKFTPRNIYNTSKRCCRKY